MHRLQVVYADFFEMFGLIAIFESVIKPAQMKTRVIASIVSWVNAWCEAISINTNH